MDTSTVTAEHIMTRHLAVTVSETNVMDAIERLIAHRVSGLPVINENGCFAGRFSERTAIAALDHCALMPESAASRRMKRVNACDLMQRQCLVLNAAADVFESVQQLLTHKVSGAPVVDDEHNLVGVFSEQSAMRVFIGLCWEQMPTSSLMAWVDRHEDRQINEETSLVEILDRFQQTPYRRLMVMHGSRLLGQVTRRDALQAVLEHTREPLVVFQSAANNVQPTSEDKMTVASWMRVESTSTFPNADVLAIAQQFLNSAARQIPVLENGRLLGQISRSDLLRAVQRFFPAPRCSGNGAQPLYLSSVNKREAHALM